MECSQCGSKIDDSILHYLVVEAEVRYWEDAMVNGFPDADASLIPLRDGPIWKPVIEMQTGRIVDWPQGYTADIHYKVCDQGQYWLADAVGKKIMKWRGDYVPNSFLCFGDNGYGDYIIFQVDESGMIAGWTRPYVSFDDWEKIA